MAHPSVERRISSFGLYHQLMQLMVPGTSAFEGINAVQPRQMVIVERQNGDLRPSHQDLVGFELSTFERSPTELVR